jgi:hypothetical protein
MGIPLDEEDVEPGAGIRQKLDLNRFATADNTPGANRLKPRSGQSINTRTSILIPWTWTIEANNSELRCYRFFPDPRAQ